MRDRCGGQQFCCLLKQKGLPGIRVYGSKQLADFVTWSSQEKVSFHQAIFCFEESIDMEAHAAKRFGLSGRNCLVTGGTKGIGEAIVTEFCGLGAHVSAAVLIKLLPCGSSHWTHGGGKGHAMHPIWPGANGPMRALSVRDQA